MLASASIWNTIIIICLFILTIGNATVVFAVKTDCANLKEKQAVISDGMAQLSEKMSAKKSIIKNIQSKVEKVKLEQAEIQKDYDANCYWIFFYKKECKARNKLIAAGKNTMTDLRNKIKTQKEDLSTIENAYNRSRQTMLKVDSEAEFCRN